MAVPTFEELVRLEPRLGALLIEAKAVRRPRGKSFCANLTWYRVFKPRLCQLVGWERAERHPVLSTNTAYDVAYDRIYDVLPNCRRCLCL